MPLLSSPRLELVEIRGIGTDLIEYVRLFASRIKALASGPGTDCALSAQSRENDPDSSPQPSIATAIPHRNVTLNTDRCSARPTHRAPEAYRDRPAAPRSTGEGAAQQSARQPDSPNIRHERPSRRSAVRRPSLTDLAQAQDRRRITENAQSSVRSYNRTCGTCSSRIVISVVPVRLHLHNLAKVRRIHH